MNITDIVNGNTANNFTNGRTSTSATGGAGAVSQALKQADKRIQTQLDRTTAQLSAFGRLKSAVSDTQIAAKALSGIAANATPTDVKTAANKLVSAFNKAVSTADATATLSSATSESSSALGARSDLRRSVRADTGTQDALRKIGLSVAADGTLALDAKKFDAAQKADPAAVRAVLAKLGDKVEKTATQELASSGAVNGSLTALSRKASLLKTQQTTLASAAQVGSTGSKNGLAAYQANAF